MKSLSIIVRSVTALLLIVPLIATKRSEAAIINSQGAVDWNLNMKTVGNGEFNSPAQAGLAREPLYSTNDSTLIANDLTQARGVSSFGHSFGLTFYRIAVPYHLISVKDNGQLVTNANVPTVDYRANAFADFTLDNRGIDRHRIYLRAPVFALLAPGYKLEVDFQGSWIDRSNLTPPLANPATLSATWSFTNPAQNNKFEFRRAFLQNLGVFGPVTSNGAEKFTLSAFVDVRLYKLPGAHIPQVLAQDQLFDPGEQGLFLNLDIVNVPEPCSLTVFSVFSLVTLAIAHRRKRRPSSPSEFSLN